MWWSSVTIPAHLNDWLPLQCVVVVLLVKLFLVLQFRVETKPYHMLNVQCWDENFHGIRWNLLSELRDGGGLIATGVTLELRNLENRGLPWQSLGTRNRNIQRALSKAIKPMGLGENMQQSLIFTVSCFQQLAINCAFHRGHQEQHSM